VFDKDLLVCLLVKSHRDYKYLGQKLFLSLSSSLSLCRCPLFSPTSLPRYVTAPALAAALTTLLVTTQAKPPHKTKHFPTEVIQNCYQMKPQSVK
jgi:hypothetical protein